MSEHIFTLPDLGEGTVEAEVSEWHVKVGDFVKEDQPIADMLTDKAAVEVPAPVTGTITKLGGELGDIIAVGAPLVVFETDANVTVSASPAEAAPPAKPSPTFPWKTCAGLAWWWTSPTRCPTTACTRLR